MILCRDHCSPHLFHPSTWTNFLHLLLCSMRDKLQWWEWIPRVAGRRLIFLLGRPWNLNLRLKALPETNSKFAPENQWLEDDMYFFGWPVFGGLCLWVWRRMDVSISLNLASCLNGLRFSGLFAIFPRGFLFPMTRPTNRNHPKSWHHPQQKTQTKNMHLNKKHAKQNKETSKQNQKSFLCNKLQ